MRRLVAFVAVSLTAFAALAGCTAMQNQETREFFAKPKPPASPAAALAAEEDWGGLTDVAPSPAASSAKK